MLNLIIFPIDKNKDSQIKMVFVHTQTTILSSNYLIKKSNRKLMTWNSRSAEQITQCVLKCNMLCHKVMDLPFPILCSRSCFYLHTNLIIYLIFLQNSQANTCNYPYHKKYECAFNIT